MNISDSIVKKDHAPKMGGSAIYAGDYPVEGVLFGKLLHSSKAKARIAEIRLPEIPEGYFVVDKNDVPGDNNVNIVKDVIRNRRKSKRKSNIKENKRRSKRLCRK